MREKTRTKKTPRKDWHQAQIVAAVRMAGWSIRSLSQDAGLKPGTLKTALQRRWPRGQQILADAIGVPPQQIWPSRYRVTPKKRRSAGQPARVSA